MASRTMMRIPGLAVLGLGLVLSPNRALAQIAATPIKDNSFLVEEAYNQEAGVVQHISALSLLRGGDWAYSFTQEWPVRSERHQLSITLPVSRVGGPGARDEGLGDLALNYRWQAIGGGEARVAFSPRLSLLLPSGNSRRGLGSGSTSLQVNLPLSAELSSRIVTHWNAGGTYAPSARNASGAKARGGALNLAHSVVWLAHPRVNLLVETAWTRSWEVNDIGRSEPVDRLFVSPGVRWSYDFANGLQIVPGLALALGVGPSRGERAVFLYLSFEHPFGRKHGE